MESLLPIALILNFVFLVTSAALLFAWLKRGGRIHQLENMLNEAGGVAASSKRTVELMQDEHHSERERLSSAESDMARLSAELDTCKQSNQEMAEALEGLEPARTRAREAEDKLLIAEKDTAAMRRECALANKRVETAEAVGRDKQIQFERVEASLAAKDKLLLAKQEESAGQEQELVERRAEIAELIAERDTLKSMEAALTAKLKETEASFKAGERARLQLNDELAARTLELGDVSEQLALLKKLTEEQAIAGGSEAEQRKQLQDQLLELEGKLSRKEAALSDLETAYADAEREKPYEAHRHMEWTINHFDPKAITFKFTNDGAKVYLVGVETDVPELRYEFETGHDLPRDDFEARIKLAIKKVEQKKLEQLPDEFDMTVLYAMHVFPIRFKIRPREGQKIERVY